MVLLIVLILIIGLERPLNDVGSPIVKKSRPKSSVICRIKSRILIIPLLPDTLNVAGGKGMSVRSKAKKFLGKLPVPNVLVVIGGITPKNLKLSVTILRTYVVCPVDLFVIPSFIIVLANSLPNGENSLLLVASNNSAGLAGLPILDVSTCNARIIDVAGIPSSLLSAPPKPSISSDSKNP